ncbi:MAG: endonuclease/exonuclease/phosphatase family protein [Paludibacteraceae bacterium]|nr:endonuclease/exonuclease/phosphatase family protein [Paludibacteraceae bacterium]
MLLLIAHIVICLCLLAAMLSVWLPPSVLPIPAWFGLAFEWLLMAEIVLGLLLLFTRRRRWAWLTVVMLVVCAAPVAYTVSHGALFFPKRELPDSFTLMSYNTHLMGGSAKPKQNRIIQYILRTQPDVVCLQEVEVHKSDDYLTLSELREALNVYPYTYFDFKIYNSRRQYGNAVFSRYPLIGKHTLRYESKGNITSVCDILLPNQKSNIQNQTSSTDTLRLYINHLESNRVSLGSLAPTLSEAEKAVHELSSTSDRLEKASELRIRQAKVLRDDVARSPYPVLVVGDMNTTPVSYTYRILQTNLRDAFLESSNGNLGHTLAKRFGLPGTAGGRLNLGIRIDYILHSKNLQATDFDIPHVDYSDHYPILTTIHY